jgi:hypothetical protein
MPGLDLVEAENAGKVRLGGCVVSSDFPDYACNRCGLEWKGKIGPKDYKDIEELLASTDTWPGTRYCVEVDFIHARVSWNKSRMFCLEGKEESLERAEMDVFLDGLRRCGLLNWRGCYYQPVLDGARWDVRIRFSDAVMVKKGSNGYPDEWDEFCRLAGGIAGGEFK